MRYLYFIIVSSLASCCGYCQHISTYNSKDLQALNDLANKWERYWNMHDMDSMGTLLGNDVDFINVRGNWLKGKIQVIQDHKVKHQSVKFKTSVWQTGSVAIRYIKPDLAIMHISWGISGDFENDGTPRQPRHGIFTWLVSKQNKKWLLLAVQNTNKQNTIQPAQ